MKKLIVNVILNFNPNFIQLDYFITACRDLQDTINFLCLVKLFEIPHQLFGFLFNKDRTIWYLVLNRIFIFSILIQFETRLLTKPVTYYLVLLYAIFDINNYIYYLIRILDVNMKIFKWFKCTLWILVYPLIFLCEAVVLIRSIPYYGETKKFTYELPNNLNFSFSFLTLLRIYLFGIYTPGTA